MNGERGMRLMGQSLLAERFKLKVHFETRKVLQVYMRLVRWPRAARR